MLIRLVHTQSTDGALLVTDIDSGLPNEEFGFYRKQPVYVPYHRTYFGSDNLVKVDQTKAGFVDLVPSDKARLSADSGVIKGLSDNGFLTVTEIPTGALAAPTISAVTMDDATGGDDSIGTVDDGSLTIDGTNFTSYAPDVTSISVTDGATSVELTDADTGVSVSDTQITITGNAHGFAATVTEVTVTANSQDVTSTVTATV